MRAATARLGAPLLFGTVVMCNAALLCFFAGMVNISKHDISSAQSFRNRHPLGSHIPLSLEHLGIPATAMQLWASLLLQCECYCTASLLLQCKCIPATANATALHPCYCTACIPATALHYCKCHECCTADAVVLASAGDPLAEVL